MKISKYLWLVASVLLGANFSSCSNGTVLEKGVLSFNVKSVNVTQDSSTEVVLSLEGSSPDISTKVNLSSLDPKIAIVSPNTCVLSSESGSHKSCEVTIYGVSVGHNTNIVAKSAGYSDVSVNANVISNSVPGSLVINIPSNNVTMGNVTDGTVVLSGSSGVSDLEVDINSNNSTIATVSPTKCVLSSGVSKICKFKISGINLGTTQIKASALGYNSTQKSITTVSSSHIESGYLYFDTSSVDVSAGGYKYVALSLLGSSGVSNLSVSLSASNSSAQIYPSVCKLSSTSNICIVTVMGKSAGDDVIYATAASYQTSQMTAIVSNSIQPGNLLFNHSSQTINVNESGNLVLSLINANGVKALPVKLTTEPSGVVSLSRRTCTLSSSDGGNSCEILLTGGASAGNTIITASADGYSSITDSITIQNIAPIKSKILFDKSSFNTVIGMESVPITLALDDGPGGVVHVTSTNTGIATIQPSTCTLSPATPMCQVYATGKSVGSSTINAIINTGSGSNTAKTVVNVSSTPINGYLMFTPSSVMIAAVSGSSSSPVKLSLVDAAGVNNLYVVPQVSPAYQGVIGTTLGYCCLSSNTESSSCSFEVNTNSTEQINTTISTQTLAGNGGSCNSPSNWNDYNNSPATLAVSAITPVVQERTFNVVNKCNYPVYLGISGGALGAGVTNCPSGSMYDSVTGMCYWTNPVPSDGYKLSANGGTTSLTIPASYLASDDVQWSGGIIARTGCTESGLCQTGGCSGAIPGQGNPSIGLACKNGTGFDSPNSAAEFTLQSNGNDHYDITLISGVIVPISMEPTNNTINMLNTPYYCGNAGATYAQKGTNTYNGVNSPMTLYAATWLPAPSNVTSSVTTPLEAFNYVSGSSSSNTSCTTNSDCISSASGNVCGYTYDAITTGTALTYKFSCGSRLGFITGSGIYAANPHAENNMAPFDFGTTLNTAGANPNGYTNWQFYQCPGPTDTFLLNSGYQESTISNANACGATNWNGIASPVQPWIFSNQIWNSEVLPRISWVKEACPTCYSYQYDDPASSFQCRTNGTDNPGNSTNYTITFCPNG